MSFKLLWLSLFKNSDVNVYKKEGKKIIEPIHEFYDLNIKIHKNSGYGASDYCEIVVMKDEKHFAKSEKMIYAGCFMVSYISKILESQYGTTIFKSEFNTPYRGIQADTDLRILGDYVFNISPTKIVTFRTKLVDY